MKNTKTLRLAQYAILIAIMLVMGFTPLGYLKIGVIEISPMMIPVAIGAIVLGPVAGTILGAVFGATSFIQCFGMSAFGVFILSINPIYTFIICVYTRTLMGLLVGLIFRGLHKNDKTHIASFAVANFSSAFLNTFFFVGALILLFWNNSAFIGQMNEWGMETSDIIKFLTAFVGINGVVEMLFATIVGTAISKPLHKYFA